MLVEYKLSERTTSMQASKRARKAHRRAERRKVRLVKRVFHVDALRWSLLAAFCACLCWAMDPPTCCSLYRVHERPRSFTPQQRATIVRSSGCPRCDVGVWHSGADGWLRRAQGCHPPGLPCQPAGAGGPGREERPPCRGAWKHDGVVLCTHTHVSQDFPQLPAARPAPAPVLIRHAVEEGRVYAHYRMVVWFGEIEDHVEYRVPSVLNPRAPCFVPAARAHLPLTSWA